MLIAAGTGRDLGADGTGAAPAQDGCLLVQGQARRMERAYQRLLLVVTVPVIALVAVLSAWQYWTERERLVESLQRTALEQRLILDAQLKAAADYVALMQSRVERALAEPSRHDGASALWPRPYQVPRASGPMTVASLDHLRGTDLEPRIASILGEEGPTLAASAEVAAAIELFELMRTAHAANPDFVWSYYFSELGRFISIFPFRPAEELLATADADEMRIVVDSWHTIDVLRMGLPGVNPDRHGYWTPAYNDPAGRGWVVSHGIPVAGPDGRYAGGVGIDFAVDHLAATLAGVRPAVGESFLVSQDGQVLAGSGLPEGAVNVTEAMLVPPTPLAHAPWMLVTVVPQRAVPLYLLPRLAPYGAILFALLAAVLAAHLLMQRRFVRPSLRLLEHIHAEAEDRAKPNPSLPELWRPWAQLVSEAFGSGRETRKRLQEAEARFLAAVDSIPDGLAIFDAEDRLVFHNRRYPDHLAPSVRAALAIGRPFEDIIREGVANGPVYHPDMGADFAERRLAKRSDPQVEHEQRLADGRWLRIRENRMSDGGRVLLTTDVSAAKAAQTALHESELRYRAVVETQTEFVVRFTPDGLVTFCNDAYVRFTGIDREALMSEDYSDFILVHPEDRELHDRHVASLTPDNPTGIVVVRTRRPDGLVRVEEWSDVGIFDEAGRLVEIQAVGRDVTEQRRVEAELARQREALHQSEKLAALGSLLAGVAHELNNPLSIVAGYATMLRDLSTDEATRRRGEMIHAAAERCARIVRSFLAMARSEPRAIAPVQVNGLVEAALEMLAYGLRTADVQVDRRLAAELPAVLGDADQLHQVVTNLVINAQQAMQSAATPRRLTVRTKSRGRWVVIEIADTGPGVPEALKPRIFDPFFTTKPVGVGTGLGLSVSRGIVVAHKGTLEIADAPGGGALFRMRLPASEAAEAAAAAGEAARPAATAARILVVDDEPGLLAMLVETLEHDGHRVAIAHSGREALARIEDADFDLILTDLRMPDLDGAAMVRVLQDRHPDLLSRLILMTGDVLGAGLTTSVMEAMSPLAVKPPLVEKPVDLELLRRVLAERLAAAGPLKVRAR